MHLLCGTKTLQQRQKSTQRTSRDKQNRTSSYHKKTPDVIGVLSAHFVVQKLLSQKKQQPCCFPGFPSLGISKARTLAATGRDELRPSAPGAV